MNTYPLLDRHVVAIPTVPALPPSAVQELWFATQRRPWLTLAMLAPEATPGVCALATAFVAVGRLTHTGEVDMLSTQGAKLREVSWHLLAMTQAQQRGARLVVAADPVVTSPVALPLVRAADAALLVVTLGESGLAAAIRTIEVVGRERILGCVLLDARVTP
jgi:hypothetical protein